MIPKLFTPYERPEEDSEKGNPVSKVEKIGYVKPNVLIENMIYAGKRLDQARHEMYDFPPGVDEGLDDIEVDPTRRPGFDLVDAGNLMNGALGRLTEQRKLFEKEEKERNEKDKVELAELRALRDQKAKEDIKDGR